uniref:poly(ADP-ribose) glycohydrolase n=1 Tax=Phlebotomus papatasi TaxID=29031 RepID=A0A1B0CZ63_PHLPP
MALVMLPCEMPWWSMVHRKLADIQKCSTVDHLVEHMQKIHDTCNVSLDPDEDKRDCTIFFGLRIYMNNHLSPSERDHLLQHTIPNIARRAQELRNLRPSRGLSFSLQQHSENVQLDYSFVASLLANAFFSTFPKRTAKTHPTLQDFNFTHFFVDLATSNSQRAKFKALMYYFDWLEKPGNTQGCLKMSRRVMTGRQWLTIEDWMECGVPLSGIEIKHEARIERSPPDVIQTVFATSRVGGSVLWSGNSQESLQLCTVPEALATLLYVEALEDNETLYVEGGRQVARIMDARGRAIVELLESPREVCLNLMDAEIYEKAIGESQFEEDNILRELNKCLLAFRQHLTCAVFEPSRERRDARRLSPIGESGTNSPGDAPTMATIVIKQASSTKSSESSVRQQDANFLSPSPSAALVVGPTASGRRGRFIVLGSSGECLPVTRRSLSQCTGSSLYSSCESSDDEFHSARNSVSGSDDEDDEEFARKYSQDLDTPEKRFSFAQKLREALQQSESYTESTEDSYACGISVADSKNCDNAIRVRRAGSDGFVLQADSLDDTFYGECLKYGDKMICSDGQKAQNGALKSRDRRNSSKYSFSTELSSELEEVYEQFSKWMEDPIGEKERELDPRDAAVLRFASSLLKRTLSESFVGVPLTEGCVNSVGNPAEEASIQSYQQKQEKPILNSRSLSVELAKHKHRLAAQLVKKSLQGIGLLCRDQSKKHRKWSISLVHTLQTINCGDIVVKPPVEIAQILHRRKGNSNLKPVATGNWGCGRKHQGDVQLKFVIQWMAASVAGLPVLIYHTAANEKLAKLDTVCRILLDRRWSVGRLARLTLRHAKRMLDEQEDESTQEFLEKLIGFPPPQSN